MTTAPIRLCSISSHAMDKYSECVDSAIPHRDIRAALFRMLQCAHKATEWERAKLHKRIDGDADYYVADTCYGLYVMIVKDRCLVTIYDIRRIEVDAI